jgi:hypothetical protein
MGIKRIPYKFGGSVSYDDYDTIVQRINQFDNVTNIGKDESGIYDIYCIEMGNLDKPTILVEASLHGTEWQGTSFSMRFMEELRDNTFPDKAFRSKLLSMFHIAYIPVLNPYGYDTQPSTESDVEGRYNSNGVDLNQDFDNFTQAESQHAKSIMDSMKPFAFLDIHLMRNGMDGSDDLMYILGNGQSAMNILRNSIIKTWEFYTSDPIKTWSGPSATGLARHYMKEQTNPHTKETLSYISEIVRPVDYGGGGLDAPLSDSQIMEAGMYIVYLFFLSSMEFFFTRKQNL